MRVGSEPADLGHFDLPACEMMFVQYLPIKFPSSDTRIPEGMQCFSPLVSAIWVDVEEYVYLTVKSLYVTQENRGRPGWHLDGFGTTDRNYIWSDCCPTEFCIQSIDVADDHRVSLLQLPEKVRHQNIRTYENRHLLGLTPKVVHRVSTMLEPGYRTFVKLSVSKDRYNLQGNAHNYLFDYRWDMAPRHQERNHTTRAD